jgi:ABC-2 type transport system ATP-binding protein
MITVKHLTKVYKTPIRSNNFFRDVFFRQYKEKMALDKVSFEIGENELVGFIGPNGAGKTTTLKILAGILFPTAGHVRVFDQNPFDKKPEFLKKIAFVMGQRNQLIWELSPLDSFQLNKEIYEVSEADFKKTVTELSSLLNCQNLLKRPVKTLSLGERMKMELINSLLHRPKLIFFDEPTIGLDIFSQEAIREFIKNFQQKYGSTIILTSHYLEDVKRLAKRLIIINKGHILYDGSLKKVIDQYSKTKYISVILEREVTDKIIQSIGRPVSYQFPKVVWPVKKDVLAEKISLINKIIPYSDITIEEERLEEIIKKLFNK